MMFFYACLRQKKTCDLIPKYDSNSKSDVLYALRFIRRYKKGLQY